MNPKRRDGSDARLIASLLSQAIAGVAGIGFFILLVLALEFFLTGFGVPVPSAVLAMALLTAFFIWHGNVPAFLATGAGFLFRVFPLLFIPPLVGIVKLREVMVAEWLPLLLVVTVSTVLGLVTAALAYRTFHGRGRAE